MISYDATVTYGEQSRRLGCPQSVRTVDVGIAPFPHEVAVAVVCVACYFIPFAQMLLSISVAAKGGMGHIYSLAKASQYTAITPPQQSRIAANTRHVRPWQEVCRRE